jgi:hypothetical protein
MSSMTSQNRNILKHILQEWPYKTVCLSSWFEKKGAYRQLLSEYERNNWVKRIGTGAYIKPGENVDWTGALYALQFQKKVPIHIGGKTALEMHGYAHNISMGSGKNITVLGLASMKLPKWFRDYDWKVDINFKLLNLFSMKPEMYINEKKIDQYKVRISDPERAIIEMIALTPNVYSFEDTYHLLEGLMYPRMDVLQELIQYCRSDKAKRLLFWMSEACGMPWTDKIAKVNNCFGKGILSLVKNGEYISKYRIIVPRKMSEPKMEDIP